MMNRKWIVVVEGEGILIDVRKQLEGGDSRESRRDL